MVGNASVQIGFIENQLAAHGDMHLGEDVAICEFLSTFKVG